jgi:microsomal dipeptidase-like Zn-dependent dipeptidase
VGVADSAELHRASVVVDLHVHGADYLPQPFRRLYHTFSRRRPPEAGFDALQTAGVDLAVATAVGDPIVTRWYLGRSRWRAVEAQLDRIERAAAYHGVAIADTVEAIDRAGETHRPAIVLGVEGADPIDDDLDRIAAWHRRGVRLVVLVHMADNQFGTTCLPWQHYSGPIPLRRSSEPGLTRLGREAVLEMQRTGIVVDLAHADSETVRGVVDVAEAPVVSSHTGARAVEDFARYLNDDELRAIAGTGGLIGLWPYRSRRWGVRDVLDLMRHARHIAEIVGPEHLCLGTDMNGVPGVMAGYRGEQDLPLVTRALLETGFDEEEVRGIIGGNALRVLRGAA